MQVIEVERDEDGNIIEVRDRPEVKTCAITKLKLCLSLWLVNHLLVAKPGTSTLAITIALSYRYTILTAPKAMTYYSIKLHRIIVIYYE